MRDIYHEELQRVVDDLVTMTGLVRQALERATTALLQADLDMAEGVIGDDAAIDTLNDGLEARCFSLLARQAPVAGELRTVVAAMRIVTDLARMGDLSAHIAKIARMRYPAHAVPEALVPNFTLMARVAGEMVDRVGQALGETNPNSALRLADDDEEMDELRKNQFRVILDKDWPYSVEAAVDVALLGRYYERIADHATLMASRVVYVATGLLPEGENWPSA